MGMGGIDGHGHGHRQGHGEGRDDSNELPDAYAQGSGAETNPNANSRTQASAADIQAQANPNPNPQQQAKPRANPVRRPNTQTHSPASSGGGGFVAGGPAGGPAPGGVGTGVGPPAGTGGGAGGGGGVTSAEAGDGGGDGEVSQVRTVLDLVWSEADDDVLVQSEMQTQTQAQIPTQTQAQTQVPTQAQTQIPTQAQTDTQPAPPRTRFRSQSASVQQQLYGNSHPATPGAGGYRHYGGAAGSQFGRGEDGLQQVQQVQQQQQAQQLQQQQQQQTQQTQQQQQQQTQQQQTQQQPQQQQQQQQAQLEAPMYHLPTAMQHVRRSRSSQMLLSGFGPAPGGLYAPGGNANANASAGANGVNGYGANGNGYGYGNGVNQGQTHTLRSARSSIVAGPHYSSRSSSLFVSPLILAGGKGYQAQAQAQSQPQPQSQQGKGQGQSPKDTHHSQSLAPSPKGVYQSLSPSPMIQSLSPSPMIQSLSPSPVVVNSSLSASPMVLTSANSLAPSPMLQASPLPPSAPPTRRSRAGSLSAGLSLGVGGMSSSAVGAGGYANANANSAQAHTSVYGVNAGGYGGSAGAHTSVYEHASTGSIGAGMRDAVYIDSEDVRARLDALLARAGEEEEEGVLGLGLMDAKEEESVLGVEQEEEERWEWVGRRKETGIGMGAGWPPRVLDSVTGRDAADEEEAANALCTPPPSALASAFPTSVYATPTNANTTATGRPRAPSSGLQSSTNSTGFQSSANSAGVPSSANSAGALSAPHSPIVHGHPLGHRSAQASQASLRSIKSGHPYQMQQASSSQVYLGPSGSQPQSPVQIPPHGYAQQQQIPQMPQQQQQQQLQQQQQQQQPQPQAPSRAGSLTSSGSRRRSQPRSSHIHSRAASKEALPGRLSRSPSALAAAQQQQQQGSSVHAHSRASSGAGASPMSMSISIPVPVQVRAAPAGLTAKPTRPPPAPALDLSLGLALEELGRRMVVSHGSEESQEEMEAVDRRREEEEARSRVERSRVQEQAQAQAQSESGGEDEDEEMSDDELERLQFLRGLRLEDRMEFKGADFPSGMDDGFGEAAGVYGGAEEARAQALVEQAVEEEEGVLPEEPPAHPAMMRSMSRWSLGSSTMDEPVEGTNEKKKKRKSFVTAFGVGGGGGDAAEGRDAQSAPATGVASASGAGREKKRSRLASFISRLSGVGAGGTVSVPATTPSSPGAVPTSPTSPAFSFGATENAAHGVEPSVVPPVPAVPAALLPSPAILEAAVRRVKSQDSMVDGIEVSGSVYGAWDPHPVPLKNAASLSPTRLRNAPLPQVSARPPPLLKAYSEDVLGTSPPFASTRKGPSHIVWESELDKAERTGRGEKLAQAPISTLRARSNTAGDILLMTSRRPVLYKSASASVLGPSVGQQRTPLALAQPRRAPGAIHTRIQYHGPPVVQDDNLPPTPSSIASTEIEEEDEDDYGVEDQERSRLRREREHEERWTRLRANTDSDVRAQMLPTIPQSPQLPISGVATKVETVLQALSPVAVSPTQTSDQRQRLKSMPSLVHLRSGPSSPPASASTVNFGLPPLASAKTGRSSVFRGFVERMGFAGSSANNTTNNSPMSSYPGTPLSAAPGQLPNANVSTNASYDVISHYPSNGYGEFGNRSPSHSPTTSLSMGGPPVKEGGVFAPGGLLGKKKPKRKLVISGVAPNNTQAFEAVKSWCEVCSFRVLGLYRELITVCAVIRRSEGNDAGAEWQLVYRF